MPTYIIVGSAVVAVIGLTVLAFLVAMTLRRVVPTDEIHVVQYHNDTIAYGQGHPKQAYYEIPAAIPRFGVKVTRIITAIFPVSITGYDAYDKNKVPFTVDVVAFFQPKDPVVIATRVARYDDMVNQLHYVVKGAIRRVLASEEIEKIMESRSTLSTAFMDEINAQIKNWGIEILSIEFMDIGDFGDTNVITNIMSREKSSIEMLSRTAVAENGKKAQIAEITAQETASLRDVERQQTVAVSQEKAKQVVQEQAKETKIRVMAVQQVEVVKAQEIEKDKQVVAAEAEKAVRIIVSEQQVAVADNQKKVATINAEATASATKTVAQGNKDAAVLEGEGDSKRVELIGSAEAGIIKSKGLAEASAKDSMAAALQKFNDAATGIEKLRVDESIAKAKWAAIQAGLSNADIKIVTSPAGAKVMGVGLDAEGGSAIQGFLEQLTPGTLAGILKNNDASSK